MDSSRSEITDSITVLARELNAEALFCGGDLYEHDRATPDTAGFLRATFADLADPRAGP